MKRLIATLLLLIAAVALLPWLVDREPAAPLPVTGLPWQVEPLPGGRSRVFGLVPGESTLGEARAALGPELAAELELAIIAGGGEVGALEAYHGRYTAGVLTGKLVLGADLRAEAVAAMKGRALGREPTATGAWRYRLAPEDRQRAWAATIAHITFIPTVQLEADIIRQRFGAPAERLQPAGDHREHWLYPELGLDLILDPKGREVLQYVPPREFERLLRPLRGAESG